MLKDLIVMSKWGISLLLVLLVFTWGYAEAGFGNRGKGKAPVSRHYRGTGHGSLDKGVGKDRSRSTGSCIQCHNDPSYPLSLFTDNDNSLCYTCHAKASLNYPVKEKGRDKQGFFNSGRWPGKDAYEASAHWTSEELVYPGTTYEAGDCKNCHNPHGTENKAMLKAPYEPGDYSLCLNCHGTGGRALVMRESSKFIESYYAPSNVDDSAPGHMITRSSKQRNDFTNARLESGAMLPCYDCHNPHGSTGARGNPNGFMISAQRPEWDGLTNTLGDPAQARRFCFGCHVPSDGVPFSKEVEGILMNTIPRIEGTSAGEHGSNGSASCYQCHATGYTTEESLNVHNIGYGN